MRPIGLYPHHNLQEADRDGLYLELERQVNLSSLVGCFRGIAWLTSVVVPLLFLIRCFKPARKVPAAH